MFTVSIENKGLTTRLSAMSLRVSELSPELMKSVGALLAASVKQNFASEGRPSQWVPSRAAMEEGRRTLTATGRLSRSPRVSSVGSTFVEVSTGEGLGKYPIYMNFGTGSQTVSEQQRKFFWFKYFSTGRAFKKWRAMALSKIIRGNPARRFNVIQNEDVNRISQLMRDYILRGNVNFPMRVS